jgi:hypothetical protein
MKHRHITLTLTPLEAAAMRFALGNSTTAPDVMDTLFMGEPVEKAACYRASRKLEQALQRANE